MPIYEYECSSCLDNFDIRQSFSDDALKTCSKCSGELRKVISSPAIHFKGTGWYVTDYKDKDKGKDSSSAKEKAEAPKACADKCPAPCAS